MILNSLTVEGFRVIGNKIHIDFPEEGRIGIFGPNEAGKSSFFDAIEFALFGLSLRGIAKEDRITWGKNKLYVNLVFTSGEKKYQIERMLTKKGSGHKVKFVRIENGSPVPGTEVTTIRSVEEAIEEILGMDKDSYSKLIYIRQKELDALKDLQKQDREQLINKVIGIDVFDDAGNNANSDLRDEKRNLDTVETKLEVLRANHDSYVKKSKEIEDLKPDISKLEFDVKEIKNKETELKKKLKQLEWIKEYNSQKEILDLKKLEFDSQSTNLNHLKSEKSDIQKYEAIIGKVTPKFGNLSKIGHVLEQNEEEILREKEKLEDEKSKIPDSYVDRSQIIKKRSTNLKTGIGLLTLGIILVAMGSALIYSIIPGIILLGTSFIFFKRYRDFDKKLINNVDEQAIIQLIKSHEKQISKSTQRIKEIQGKYGVASSSEVEKELEKIDSDIYEKTGSYNIQGLQGVLNSLKEKTNSTNLEELETKVNSLKKEVETLEKNFANMENQKPSGTNLEDSIEEFQQTKQEYEETRQDLTEKSNELSAKQAKKNQLEDYCNDIQKDYEEYPKELEKKERIEEKTKLIDFVIQQFKLVSEKMRSLVIPQARHEINQMLPIITGNKYSDFKITEDLKFQVYTTQTGGYKERELFSGGTQDQFLIALRLAFTKSILDSRIKADEYSLFMDETISSSDEARKTGIFDLLDKARKTFKQIFIIAHEDITDVVEHNLILEAGSDGLTKVKSRSW